jgi:hypothetical protein
VTDYSVRYRCQGSRADGSRCTRTGRRTKWAPQHWLCWQHSRMCFDLVAQGSKMLMFQPELFV